MKVCSSCKKEKDLSCFYAKTYCCKECSKQKARTQYRNRGSLKQYNREEHLQRRYGISSLVYEKMLADQNGVCWICKRPPKKRRLSVDHCHTTGKVRGLLCWNCNYRLLPTGRDNPEIFQRAADYLNKT